MCACTGHSMHSFERLDDVGAAYSRATSDTAKRDVILAAIDAELIRVGMPVPELFQVVAQLPTKVTQDRPEPIDIVHFAPKITPPPGQTPYFVGWYMVIKHDGKRVWDYYLSNAYEK